MLLLHATHAEAARVKISKETKVHLFLFSVLCIFHTANVFPWQFVCPQCPHDDSVGNCHDNRRQEVQDEGHCGVVDLFGIEARLTLIG